MIINLKNEDNILMNEKFLRILKYYLLFLVSNLRLNL